MTANFFLFLFFILCFSFVSRLLFPIFWNQRVGIATLYPPLTASVLKYIFRKNGHTLLGMKIKHTLKTYDMFTKVEIVCLFGLLRLTWCYVISCTSKKTTITIYAVHDICYLNHIIVSQTQHCWGSLWIYNGFSFILKHPLTKRMHQF